MIKVGGKKDKNRCSHIYWPCMIPNSSDKKNRKESGWAKQRWKEGGPEEGRRKTGNRPRPQMIMNIIPKYNLCVLSSALGLFFSHKRVSDWSYWDNLPSRPFGPGPPVRGIREDGPPRNILLRKAARGKKRAQPWPAGQGRGGTGRSSPHRMPIHTHTSRPLSLATISPPGQNARTAGKAEGHVTAREAGTKAAQKPEPHPSPRLRSRLLFSSWEKDTPLQNCLKNLFRPTMGPISRWQRSLRGSINWEIFWTHLHGSFLKTVFPG